MKMAPHRRFGGSSVAEIFIFLSSNKNCPLFVKKVFFYLSPPKSYRAHQKNYHILSCSIFWHHNSFSKLPSNFWGLLTPPGRVRDPINHRSGVPGSKPKICVQKSQFFSSHTRKTPHSWVQPQTSQKRPDSFSKLPSNFWGLTADQSERLSTPWEGPRPPKSPIGSTCVQNKIFCTKIKILSSTEVENTCFLGSTSDLPKALEFL